MSALTRLLFRFSWAMERRIVPGNRSSQYDYYEALKPHVRPDVSWLDLGCGHQVFADWMTEEEAEVTSQARYCCGIDLDEESMRKHRYLRDRVKGDLQRLPFADRSFDVISANMVVEHLADPAAVLAEVRRCLRPGGVFVFHTTNRRNFKVALADRLPQGFKNRLILLLEQRRAEDVFPTHYAINTLAQVEALARDTGFSVESLTTVNGSPSTSMLGPVVIGELLIFRWLRRAQHAAYRTNIIAVLRAQSRVSQDFSE